MSAKPLRSLFIRLWRVGLLVAAVLVIRDAVQTRDRLEAAAALTPERVRDFFPDVDHLGEANPGNGWRTVFDRRDRAIGYATTTAPESDKIIGYSGPSHCLMVFNMKGQVTGVSLLKSHDTTEHVAEVVADEEFFAQFKAMKPGGEVPEKLHAVTGATLTSAAITEGVLAKLGRASGTSLRFPEEITLEEVTRLEGAARKLEPSKQHPGGWDVLDAEGKKIAIAVRTSPVADGIAGYKGPTDTLMLLDASGTTLKRIAIRKSYETKRYLAYVTGDDYFLNLFNETTLEKMADMDFKEAKVEGVSGATETSWAVAESLKRRSQNLLEARPSGWLRQIRWRWQDTGHLVVILSALLMAFTYLRGITWLRHAHHGLLVLYAGLMAGELLSQGLLAGWAAHGTPWKSTPGFLLLAAVALLGPVFTSKHLYCHHICPHGALQQLLARRLKWRWHLSPRVERVLSLLPFVLLAFVLMSVVFGWGADLNSLEPFDAYVVSVAGWASISIAILGLIASLFQPLAYCKYGCPTGALFKLLRFTGDGDRLGVKDWLAAGLLVIAVLA